MALNQQLSCLEAKWRELLVRRGHHIYRKASHPNVIRSCDDSKKGYCWLLRVWDRSTWNLSKSERAEIQQHLRQAQKRKETAYLVIGFTQEPKRIVAIPAEAALKAGYISRDKGGIAWDD
jgi:hypothetical protein